STKPLRRLANSPTGKSASVCAPRCRPCEVTPKPAGVGSQGAALQRGQAQMTRRFLVRLSRALVPGAVTPSSIGTTPKQHRRHDDAENKRRAQNFPPATRSRHRQCDGLWPGRSVQLRPCGLRLRQSYGGHHRRLDRDIGDAFVTAGSNMGHDGGESAAWTLGHPEKVKDWGLRAHYSVGTAAKALAGAYFGRPVKHSYFEGCSNGGRQAMMVAQNYP